MERHFDVPRKYVLCDRRSGGNVIVTDTRSPMELPPCACDRCPAEAPRSRCELFNGASHRWWRKATKLALYEGGESDGG
jgi:hypothetical protein